MSYILTHGSPLCPLSLGGTVTRLEFSAPAVDNAEADLAFSKAESNRELWEEQVCR